jgi:hypothetical protein
VLLSDLPYLHGGGARSQTIVRLRRTYGVITLRYWGLASMSELILIR